MYCNGDPVNNTDSTGRLTDAERVALLVTTVAMLAIVAAATGGTD